MAKVNKETVRCAVYCRKSVEDGLEQEFNSLDAQREAGENYIASQKGNGWVCLPQHYDDGGFSGGNTNRPALQQLLADIKDRKIDMVVVYKIDRLSRSIFDFGELQSVFDEYGVSFCSVTQEINTRTSSGRMMLNILMTFAQFEREILTERVRDKVSAAKKRGKHCGGYPVLGYDSDPITKKLHINEAEAETVKFVFEEYLRTGSAKAVATALELKGIRGKVWTTKKGVKHDGQLVNNQMIYRMLKNPLYIGRVPHKETSYPGEHQAIIEQELWDQVQNLLNGNLRHDPKQHRSKQNPFIGLLYCGTCGGAMGLVHTKKGNKRYHYYICTEDTKRNFSTCPVKRIPADALQKAVLEQVGELLQSTTLIAQMVKTDNSMTAPKFRAVLKNIHGIWSVMCHYEQCRLLQNIISRILIFDDRLEIEPKVDGIKALLKDVGVEVK